jgi:DnaJ family protein C protein 13
MASPAVRLLAPSDGAPAGCLPFATIGKAGRSPRVYAARDREALLRALQATALSKLGLTLAGELHRRHGRGWHAPPTCRPAWPGARHCRSTHGRRQCPAVDTGAQLSGAQLLAMVAAAERERAGDVGEAPLAEWEVLRVWAEPDTGAGDAPVASSAQSTVSSWA